MGEGAHPYAFKSIKETTGGESTFLAYSDVSFKCSFSCLVHPPGFSFCFSQKEGPNKLKMGVGGRRECKDI